MIEEFQVDQLQVRIYSNRRTMGTSAANIVIQKMEEVLTIKDDLNMIFAAAPSQNEFLAVLSAAETIDWTRVNAFHMDEYLGLNRAAPQLFGNFLKHRLFGNKPFKSVNYINSQAGDLINEVDRYTALLLQYPPDIVCMGIGENTHLAFNDPGDADFDDPQTLKKVPLDLVCRQQQVNDGCFGSLNDVPRFALTLTIPALMQAAFIYCMVPGPTKATAILHTLTQPVSSVFPSTILRHHGRAILFLDQDSSSLL